MLEFKLDGINIYNPIENKKDQIIDCFVEFYGEEYRRRITDRIDNTIFLFLDDVHYTRSTYQNIEYYLINTQLLPLTKSFLNKHDLFVDPNYITEIQLNPKSFLEKVLQDLQYGDRFYIMDFLSLLNNGNEFKSEYHKKFTSDKQNLIALKTFIDSLLKDWNDNFEHQYSTAQEEIDSKLKNFPQDNKNSFVEINNFKETELNNLLKTTLKKHGLEQRISNIDPFIFFNFLEYYQDPNKQLSFKATLKYLDLIKNLNIEFKDKIENCNQNEEINNIFGDNQLLTQHKNIQLNQIKSKFESCPSLVDARATLNDYHFTNMNDVIRCLYEFVFDTSNTCGFVSLEPTAKGNKYICVCGTALNMTNKTLIHEINHLCELDVLYETQDKIAYKTGFETYFSSTKESELDTDAVAENILYNIEHTSSSLGTCRFLNEVINDYLAEKIYQVFKNHNLNFSFANEQETLCTYSLGFPLLKNFIEENIDDLKKYRMEQNPNAYRDFIGHDNFDRLAQSVDKLLSIDFDILERLYHNLFSEAGYLQTKNFTEDIWDIVHENKKWSSQSQEIANIYKTVEEITDNIRQIKQKNLLDDYYKDK